MSKAKFKQNFGLNLPPRGLRSERERGTGGVRAAATPQTPV
jgi:hypothetical protein